MRNPSGTLAVCRSIGLLGCLAGFSVCLVNCVPRDRAADMSTPGVSSAGAEVISVFDPRVQPDQHWQVQHKRLSGFRKSLMPAADGATLRLEFRGRAVSLLRASPWRAWPTRAGQAYGVSGEAIVPRPSSDLSGAQMRVSVDGGKPRTVELASAPVEIPLAEGLSAGAHRVELTFPRGCRLCVLGFRALSGPFGVITGRVTGDASDYLNDISVEIYRDGQLVEERLDRNPATGQVLVWGLEPGTYHLRVHALGWQERWLRGICVKSGAATDFGRVHLASQPLAKPRGPIAWPNRGCPTWAKPGESLEVAYRAGNDAGGFDMALVRRFRTYHMAVARADFDQTEGLWRLQCRVPREVPDGLYHLRVQSNQGEDLAAQAVYVRKAFGSRFRVVKFGHMDTWTQRNAQYVRLLADLVNLIHPDLLLVSNEVNWHYVVGALADLDVAYLITSGNHGLPGFERYFGPAVGFVRMGDVFVGNFGRDWQEDTGPLEAAFEHAAGARYRILQGVESDLPEDLGRRLGVDFYAFGHGFTHEWLGGADRRDVQPRPWLHLGKEFHLVQIDLETGKAHVASAAEEIAGGAAKYPIPRDQPWAPVVFEPASDGRHRTVRATVRNPLRVALQDARVRFLMPAGQYGAEPGRIVQALRSDDGRFVEVVVSVDVPAQGRVDVEVRPAK